MDMPIPCAAKQTSMLKKPTATVVSAVAPEKMAMPISRTVLREKRVRR